MIITELDIPPNPERDHRQNFQEKQLKYIQFFMLIPNMLLLVTEDQIRV